MPNKKENKLVLYKDDEGKLSVNTLFADEDVWLTQAQLVEIYKSSKSNISEHLRNIFNDNELDKEVVGLTRYYITISMSSLPLVIVSSRL